MSGDVAPTYHHLASSLPKDVAAQLDFQQDDFEQQDDQQDDQQYDQQDDQQNDTHLIPV